MSGALLWLWFRSRRNRLRRSLERLRQPQRLVGVLLASAYFLWLFLGRFAGPKPTEGPRPGGRVQMQGLEAALSEDLLPLLVLVFLAFAWLGNNYRTFRASRAEVTWLLQAPLSRATLQRSLLLRDQGGIVVSAVVMALFFTWGTTFPYSRALLGAWLVLTLLQLQGVLAAAIRLRLRARWGGLTAWVLPAAVFVVILAVPVGAAAALGLWEAPAASGTALAVHILGSELAVWISAPSRILLAPVLVEAPPLAWGADLAGALLLLGLHLPVVSRLVDPVLVEALHAAAEARERRERVGRGRSARRGARRSPWRLGARGRAEIAFLWKGLAGQGRWAYPRNLLLVPPTLLLLGILRVFVPGEAAGAAAGTLGGLLLAASAIVLLAAGRGLGAGIQRDLGVMDLLKALPCRGRTILLGEVLAPVAVGSCLVLTLTSAGLLLLVSPLGGPIPLRLALAILFTVGLLAPPYLLVANLVTGGLALYWPEIFAPVDDQAQGVERTGRGFLLLLARLVVFLLLVLPALLATGLTAGLLWLLVGSAALVASAAVGAGVFLLEAVALLLLTERLYDDFDPHEQGVEAA